MQDPTSRRLPVRARARTWGRGRQAHRRQAPAHARPAPARRRTDPADAGGHPRGPPPGVRPPRVRVPRRPARESPGPLRRSADRRRLGRHRPGRRSGDPPGAFLRRPGAHRHGLSHGAGADGVRPAERDDHRAGRGLRGRGQLRRRSGQADGVPGLHPSPTRARSSSTCTRPSGPCNATSGSSSSSASPTTRRRSSSSRSRPVIPADPRHRAARPALRRRAARRARPGASAAPVGCNRVHDPFDPRRDRPGAAHRRVQQRWVDRDDRGRDHADPAAAGDRGLGQDLQPVRAHRDAERPHRLHPGLPGAVTGRRLRWRAG